MVYPHNIWFLKKLLTIQVFSIQWADWCLWLPAVIIFFVMCHLHKPTWYWFYCFSLPYWYHCWSMQVGKLTFIARVTSNWTFRIHICRIFLKILPRCHILANVKKLRLIQLVFNAMHFVVWPNLIKLHDTAETMPVCMIMSVYFVKSL